VCCFSGPVSVQATQIFARLLGGGRQVLVYQMEYQASAPTAMVLPLPVALPAHEDSLEFIDLKSYPDFFLELERAFPQRRVIPTAGIARKSLGATRSLRVESVGDFVASFVPRIADFKRLDSRFVLPESVWAKLPPYADYGFAVFQLAQLSGKPHPMAFSFPTRLTKSVFFPTVHIHDGLVHPQERFDHALYTQDAGWGGEGSAGPLREYLRNPLAASLVDLEAGARKLVLEGSLPNQDTILPASPAVLSWLAGGAALAGATALGAARKLLLPKKQG
jgi:hypothetical protein